MSALQHVGRRAFTLVELMIATAILAIVAVQMGVGFTGLFRLMRHSYAESEIAIAEHKMHDRILFMVKPGDDSAMPFGGLSCTNLTITANGLDFKGSALGWDFASASSYKSHTLTLDSSSRMFSLDNDPAFVGWLNPANMFSLDTDIMQIMSVTNSGKLLFLDISMRMRDGQVSRAQRIMIPAFGRQQ